MNIKEAVEWLEIIKEGYEYGDIDSAVTVKGYKRCVEAIETVLNELNKKDKVIDMMAECIDGEPTFGYGHLRDINTPEKVKEYFYNKIEIPEEN